MARAFRAARFERRAGGYTRLAMASPRRDELSPTSAACRVADEASSRPSLSVVVPVHDEAASLPRLHEELGAVLARLPHRAEIVFVDDGSGDGSADVVRALLARDARVRLVRLRRNAGLTAALTAGFEAARGEVVVTLDGDGQNDPADIPRVLAALADADAAIGWRRQRRDGWLRRASSRVANGVRNLVTGERVHDSGCGLRAVRRACLRDLPHLDGIHRFFPTVLRAAGHRVAEVEVRHRPRRHGRAHFGVRNRARVAAQDLLALRWLLARRVAYEAVEDTAAGPRPLAVVTAPPPRRRPALRLAACWAAVAILLAGWGALAGRQPTRDVAAGTTELQLFAPRPHGAILALWLRWDAPPGLSAWAIAEGADAWSAADEMTWRRRIHPGWNYLVWPEVWTLPADGPVRLRLADGAGAAWQVAAPRVDLRYGLHHLTPLRGLLLAAALALVAAAARANLPGRERPRPAPGRWWLAVAGVAAAALWLRAHTLTLQSLWFDEVLTAIGAQDLAWILHTPQIFGHPPLQYVAAWLVGGNAAAEGWLRLPSLVAGVATVGALAALGRRLHGPAAGLLAAAALAVAPLHVELSQLARPYAFFLLFTVLSLGALLVAVERHRTRDWLWLTALLALNLYTHYLALQVLVLLALTALALLARRRWRGGLAALLSFAGAVLLLLPWLPVLRRLGAAQVGRGELPAGLLYELVTQVFVTQFLGEGIGTGLGLALMACAFWSWRRRPNLALVALLWLALPLALLWLAQPAHFIAGRHLAFTLPLVMLLLGQGVATVAAGAARAVGGLGPPRRVLPPLGAAVAAGILVVAWGTPAAEGLRGYYQGRAGADWRTVASVLDRVIGDGDRVLATVGAVYPLRYYWQPRVEELGPGGFPERPAPGAARAWIVTHEGRDAPADLGPWLAAHAIKVGEVPASWSLPHLKIYRLRPHTR
jgi:dolichol-phosphate mannosyltransferase